ncbi:hypothetical protein N0V88_007205 [Collariella sp. IMI 366227]|nr:hypothetical protein N0V88_007205 [Collariella sp. IMI 366227]
MKGTEGSGAVPAEGEDNIPRSSTADPSTTACPANDEQETGSSTTGHWVYPSEKQFFEAMKRKGHAAAAADMKTVVPIHNAVNERAWAEILKWEAPPKLNTWERVKMRAMRASGLA